MFGTQQAPFLVLRDVAFVLAIVPSFTFCDFCTKE